jgi:hypothetical protein
MHLSTQDSLYFLFPEFGTKTPYETQPVDKIIKVYQKSVKSALLYIQLHKSCTSTKQKRMNNGTSKKKRLELLPENFLLVR